jgi:hypothetical protein
LHLSLTLCRFEARDAPGGQTWARIRSRGVMGAERCSPRADDVGPIELSGPPLAASDDFPFIPDFSCFSQVTGFAALHLPWGRSGGIFAT